MLYIYSGERKKRFVGVAGKDFPDTQLYGANHLSHYGITAESAEVSPLLRRLFGFRIAHALLFFKTFGYNVVFGSSLLYQLFFKKIFRTKTKFVLFNISTNRLLAAHAHHPLRRRLLSWLLSSVDAAVCLSHAQKDFLEQHAPHFRGKTFFVPLGVDTAYYMPHHEEREHFILSAGRDNGRDYATVLRVAESMPHERFEIICSKRNVVGIGSIPHNVTVRYDVPVSAYRERLQKAKMFLLATHDDSFLDGSDCSGQTVLLDAMASGCPVIATKKAYLPDYTENGKEIAIVPSGDVAGIVRTIEEYNDASVRERGARAARARVLREFSTVRMAEHLAAIFESIATHTP